MRNLVSSALALLALTGVAVESVTLPELAAPGLIDGELSESCWEEAYATGPFTAIKPDGKVTEATEARIFRDKENLFIGVKCAFRDYALREKIITSGEKGGYYGDCVEIFLDPGDTGNLAHIAINIAGNITPLGLAEPITYAVQVHERDWTLEAKIPCRAIKLATDQFNADWRINIARGNYKVGESTSWSKLDGGVFQDLAAFNRVREIPANLLAIRKAQLAAVRKDFEITFDRLVYAGQPTAKAALDVIYKKPMKGFAAKLVVKDAKGTEVFAQTKPMTAFHVDFEIPLAGFADVQHVATLAVTDGDGKVVRSGERTFWKVPPMDEKANAVRFTIKNHCIYRNGEFFFPIITWHCGCSKFESREQWLADTDREFADMAEHGHNAVIGGTVAFPEGNYDSLVKAKSIATWDAKRFQQLHAAGIAYADIAALAAKHGIGIIGVCPYKPKSPFATDRFVDELCRIRTLPNVICWHTADETDGQVEYNQFLNRLYHEIDPTRFTWLNVINAVSANKDAADVLSTDPYPIPNGRVTAVATHGDRLIQNTEGRPGVARWLWLQNFAGEGSWTRPPTPDEVRCMAMLAVNHGATGIAYFNWQPPERRKPPHQDPESYAMLKELNPYLTKWTPALCQGEVKFRGRQGDLDVLAVVFEGRKILSVVNIESKPIENTVVGVVGFGETKVSLGGFGTKIVEID